MFIYFQWRKVVLYGALNWADTQKCESEHCHDDLYKRKTIKVATVAAALVSSYAPQCKRNQQVSSK
jgi:hypothetical protein